MSSVTEVIQTVDHTKGCFGVVAIENSTEGELTTVTDKLIFDAAKVRILDEAVLAESMCAFGLGDASLASTVVSHPLVLDLCSRFIRERGLAVRHVLSTAEACRIVAHDNDLSQVALAPLVVGRSSGLKLYEEAVLDVPEIRTRYVLIGQGLGARSGRDRTILAITPSTDTVGSLQAVAGVFSAHDVNMTAILSRPLQAKLGFHTFHITCDGHLLDDPMSSVVRSLLHDGHAVKHLGSFPRWGGVEVTTPFATLPLGSVDRSEQGELAQPVLELFGLGTP
jgi:prephenate dehydratase